MTDSAQLRVATTTLCVVELVVELDGVEQPANIGAEAASLARKESGC
jgi:hypothetical protein